MSRSAFEVVWPLDRCDYLTVCDEHPSQYYCSIAWMARWWGDEIEEPPVDAVEAAPWHGRQFKEGFRLRDLLVGHLSIVVYESLAVIMPKARNIGADDMAIVSKSLLWLARDGRVERVKINGKWAYRATTAQRKS